MIPDVSIIVPCYNVAAYVDSCLDSLVRQTLRNIEIICINDGSTDETWIHLLRWKEKDSRIILLNQRNAGVSAARNAGLDAARGLYVLCGSRRLHGSGNVFPPFFGGSGI